MGSSAHMRQLVSKSVLQLWRGGGKGSGRILVPHQPHFLAAADAKSSAVSRNYAWREVRSQSMATAAAVAVVDDDRSGGGSGGGREGEGVMMKGVHMAGRPLYLDMQATSPVDPRVLDAMLPYYMDQFGNPHSRTHMYGWESDEAVEKAREQIAKLIGANAKEIIFTSGATEANNIAIKGVMHFYKDKKKHVITTQTEHKCVLDSCRHLQQEGFEVTYLPVRKDGLIDMEELKAAIRPDTGIVSIMTVNNEIGVIQPMAEIGELCRKNKIFLHTDAAQAAGKIPISVDDMKVDLMSLSAHKIYGPKGVGALYMRRRPRVRVEAQMSGGGQERGIRSGTVPTPLVVGMGAACEIAMEEMEHDEKYIKELTDRLYKGITSQLDGVIVNGSLEHRYVGNLNLSFAYVEGESLLMGLKEVAVSSGSACTSASLEPSYVLRALGVEEDMAHTSIRFGIGRFTTKEEIDRAIELTVDQVQKLRNMSPLWEMVQEGIDLKSIQWAQH
jgi:cysteine desulfurase